MTTRGEYRVGIDFNPSGNSDVNDIKKLAAEAIDLIEDLQDHGDSEIMRLKALAMTHAETAAMYAVKAATKKPWSAGDAEQDEEAGEDDGGSGS
jgi:hypothetical protein